MVDGYDVVDAGDYPPEAKLQAGAEGAYDVVMLTGSSTPISPRLMAHHQNTPHTTLLIRSSLL